jgi:hypothetical protein
MLIYCLLIYFFIKEFFAFIVYEYIQSLFILYIHKNNYLSFVLLQLYIIIFVLDK